MICLSCLRGRLLACKWFHSDGECGKTYCPAFDIHTYLGTYKQATMTRCIARPSQQCCKKKPKESADFQVADCRPSGAARTDKVWR